MHNHLLRPATLLIAGAALLLSCGVHADEAAIRRTLAERLPQLPKIDEITKTPVPGLYEVRYGGTELLYSDERGDFVFVSGSMIDTKTRTDLTEARQQKLLAVDFDKLPFKDAFVFKQGNGSRRMAVFVDPNCGYCKRFERDLTTVKDVTIYTFLMPILGADSVAKSKDIWCSSQPTQAWRSWMLDGVTPPRDAKTAGSCNTDAIDRNLAFARQQRISGTPAVIFADGTRRPGAIPAAAIEQMLVAAARK